MLRIVLQSAFNILFYPIVYMTLVLLLLYIAISKNISGLPLHAGLMAALFVPAFLFSTWLSLGIEAMAETEGFTYYIFFHNLASLLEWCFVLTPGNMLSRVLTG